MIMLIAASIYILGITNQPQNIPTQQELLRKNKPKKQTEKTNQKTFETKMSFQQLHRSKQFELEQEVGDIVESFTIGAREVCDLTYYYIKAMENGLADDSATESSTESTTKSESEAAEEKLARSRHRLPMIPTYVFDKPDGTEQGIVLAADLGGTNFRVCSVELNGDHTFKLNQQKSKIPEDLLEDDGVTSEQLFAFLAKKISLFVNTYHGDETESSSTSSSTTTPSSTVKENVDPETQEALTSTNQKTLKLGFTFSFPVDQTALNRGTLIRWTKGFKIKDCVGKDVVELLQTELQKIKDPTTQKVKVVALSNDTVGTFLSGCYSSLNGSTSAVGDISEPVIGCIIGTGFNMAYMEEIKNIKKLGPQLLQKYEQEGKVYMGINTESGSFDNDLVKLPTTKYDTIIDTQISPNPGFHLFEKRISGMFMGELLRVILVDLNGRDLIFHDYKPGKKNLPHRLTTPFELSSELLSHIEIDDSTDLRETELNLLQSLRLPTTLHDRVMIQKLVRAISKRSAYLSIVPMAAIIIKTGALKKKYHGEVEVVCDGSVVEYYPGYKSMQRDALAMSPLGPSGERKIHLKIAKDGSGLGAGLCALVA